MLQVSDDTLEGMFSGWDGAGGEQCSASSSQFIDPGSGCTGVFSLFKFSELNINSLHV